MTSDAGAHRGRLEQLARRRLEAAAPVGMLVDRAGQVGLLGERPAGLPAAPASAATAPGPRNPAPHRRPDCRLVGWRHLPVERRPWRRPATARARSCWRAWSSPGEPRPSARRVRMSSPLHQPATVGRSWVVVMATASARQRDGFLKLSRVRSNHITSMPAMPARRRRLRKPGGTVPRSSPITTARWRCDSSASRLQQVLQRIGEIGALARRLAARDQPQPHQPHDVIDAHAAGMGECGAQGGEEGIEARGDQGARREAGQAPVLAVRIEGVGRRADRQAHQQVGLARPGMAAGAVHADREVADQADAHAGGLGRLLRGGEGARRDPLQEKVIARRWSPPVRPRSGHAAPRPRRPRRRTARTRAAAAYRPGRTHRTADAGGRTWRRRRRSSRSGSRAPTLRPPATTPASKVAAGSA